eukprot:m.222329 g.222329  ORF g.222329 m.222329 type:complete len:184 (+) comp39975_c3_seq1:34-585(+)
MRSAFIVATTFFLSLRLNTVSPATLYDPGLTMELPPCDDTICFKPCDAGRVQSSLKFFKISVDGLPWKIRQDGNVSFILKMQAGERINGILFFAEVSVETTFGKTLAESFTADMCEDAGRQQNHCPLQPNQNFTHYDYATHEQVMESAQLVRKADATLKLKSSDGAILVCITLSVNFENLVYV